MGGKEIADFLTMLAVERKVSASTPNQALNALAFLYRKVLLIPLNNFDFKHARTGKRLPVVLSRDETQKVFANLQGEFLLMASILYGSGLRLSECLNLRVKDIDFSLNEIIVRGGKGDNDRRTILPGLIIPSLQRQKAVKNAVRKSRITKSASCHTFRHSFATHVLNRNKFNVQSPLDTWGSPS